MRIKLREKLLEVEAIQWTGNNLEEIEQFTEQDLSNFPSNRVNIWNEEVQDWIYCPVGHYVIKGIKGEFYPCSPEALEKSYDKIE